MLCDEKRALRKKELASDQDFYFIHLHICQQRHAMAYKYGEKNKISEK